MRVPLEWLREYCDPPLDLARVEERLTMTGTKVEAVHRHGVRERERFVVGRVLDVKPHPDADRLRVCAVDLGLARGDGPATIVCGAPNVATGQAVAVAQPGAIIADGTKLAIAKLRGVRSEGMILAEDELGIGAEHSGIIVLDELAPPADLEPGAPLAGVLPIATDVLELEVTPNRPDCLGVYGVARELHAATGAPLAPAPWLGDPGSAGALAGAQVRVECPDLCPRFTARLFEHVRIAPSPLWLKARLIAAGQRPINNVVDITNYVMLLTAQPLHAFDFDLVAGGRLTVRRARPGEPVQTLDGQTRELDSEMVVIEDADGPTSIAGIMGGARSEVSESTTRVLLEVANWDGPNIHRAAWALGLRSEASARFEKGLPPESCDYAQAVAATLMIDLCGADLIPGTIDVAALAPPPATVSLRPAQVSRILGVHIPVARQVEILRALDFELADADPHADEQILDVGVPPMRRRDVTREADLIEEIARIAGLEQLPVTLPARRGAYGVLSPVQRLRRRTVDALVGCGLHEVMGWTFSSPAVLDELRLAPGDPRRRAVELEDPLSSEQSLLRTMLLGSLRTIAAYNAARDTTDLALFEIGTTFEQAAPETGDGERPAPVRERHALGVLMSGHALPATWRSDGAPPADFYALKAVLEALCAALDVSVRCLPADPDAHPYLHPGRAAELTLDGAGDDPTGRAVPVGWLGELHPLVGAGDALQDAPVSAMELDLAVLLGSAAHAEHRYRDLISYPALRRDLAVSLPLDVAADDVLGAVRHVAGDLLEDARIFDVYTGPQVGTGRRSLAISLAFRDPSRTLTDEDVEPAWHAILARLHELGGELRA
jgi:phenylalanyl-tRNA synthetase beta chain